MTRTPVGRKKNPVRLLATNVDSTRLNCGQPPVAIRSSKKLAAWSSNEGVRICRCIYQMNIYLQAENKPENWDEGISLKIVFKLWFNSFFHLAPGKSLEVRLSDNRGVINARGSRPARNASFWPRALRGIFSGGGSGQRRWKKGCRLGGCAWHTCVVWFPSDSL